MRRRTNEEWLEIVTRWQSSDQSAKSFCAENDLNVSRFYKRRRDLKRMGVLAKPVSAFVPVVPIGRRPLGMEASITVELGSVTIRCPTGIAAQWLAELVTQLQR
jgi:hypothetical protein